MEQQPNALAEDQVVLVYEDIEGLRTLVFKVLFPTRLLVRA